MIHNYFKLALRNLFKYKVFSAVNIFGLALGISASLLLFLYIGNELSYDQFHTDKERIYRLRCDNLNNGQYSERMAVTNGPVAKTIKAMFPEVEEYVQMNKDYLEGLISTDLYKFRMKDCYFASEAFFKVFSYKLLKGDLNTALKEVNSIVLSESMAKKFFGNEDPLGKIVKYNNQMPWKVTGVFEDLPPISHMKFEALVSYTTMIKYFNPFMDTEEAWNAAEQNYTYLKLKPGTNPKKLEGKFVGMVQQKIGKLLKGKNQDKQFYLMPLTDIHLNSHFDSEMAPNGNAESVNFFIVIAIIILVIAWINYINLSTAGSFRRYKEIGIRMVTGATKSDLRKQFVFEAILINCIAVVFAFIIVKTVYPYFSAYTGMEIGSLGFKNKTIWIAFSLVIIIGAFCSSIYPAYILSSINPAEILKSKSNKKVSGFSLRKLLIGAQFGISVCLLIGTVIVLKQISFLKNQDLGTNIEQTLIVHRPSIVDSTWRVKSERLKDELEKIPYVKGACLSGFVPGEPINYTQGFIKQVNSLNNPSFLLYNNFIDNRYLKLYNLKLIAGRDFIKGNNNLEMIINRKGLKVLGFNTPEEALNQTVLNEGWGKKHTIVGVVENFHQQSPKQDYEPIIFMHCPYYSVGLKYSVKIKTHEMKRAIGEIENVWKDVFPGSAFEYFFLDEQYDNQYKADIQFGRIFLLFSIIAICIACIGLFALTLYTVIQRTKEIAIRKVIGASIADIFEILTKDYFVLVFISSIISIPLMYFVMNKWLDNYAIKVNLTAWTFLFPVIILVIMVMLSVTVLVIQSARNNPANSLRTE